MEMRKYCFAVMMNNMNAASVQISICRIHVLAENTNTSFTQKSSELEGSIFIKILYMDFFSIVWDSCYDRDIEKD